MTIFKRFVFYIALLLVPVALGAQALPKETSYYRPHYQRLQRIGTLSQYPTQIGRLSAVKAISEAESPITFAKNPVSRFGFAMEDVLKEMIKSSQGRKNIWLDAGYGGTHGIDGLLVRKNSRGQVTDVNVYEFKSQNAKLESWTKNGPQMSKKWIMNSLKKSIVEKEKKLLKLEDKIKKAESKGRTLDAKKLKEEFSNINKERNQLKQAQKLIQQGRYGRYLYRLKYSNGQIVTVAQEIQGENRFGTPKLGAEKQVENMSFSVLDKDNTSLSHAQRRFKNTFFKEIRKEMIKQGRTPEEADLFVKNMRENGIDIKDSVQKKALANIEKKGLKLQKGMKAGFALLAVASEVASIYQWQTGSMSTSEFVFDSIANAASLGMLFIKAIGNSNPITTIIFCAIDTAKNFWAWRNGRMSTSDFVIESIANTIGLVVASVVATAVGSIAAIASLNPILGAIIGFAVFTAVYTVTKWIVKFIGRAIVDHYEAIKQPEHFRIICDDVRRVCNL